MIRPITLICFAAACGSGLYLYQAKHRVHVLDQKIEQTVQQTEKTRAQTRMLHAEWTLLNDPDRLRKLAAQFLPQLQPVAPSQYTDLADLGSRLPAVLPPPAPPAPDAAPDSGVPVAQAAPNGGTAVAQVAPDSGAPVGQATPNGGAAVAQATPAPSSPAPAPESVRTASAAQPETSAPARLARSAMPSRQVALALPRPRPPAPRQAAARPVVAQVERPLIRTTPQIHNSGYDPYAAQRIQRQREARIEARREHFRPPPPAYRRPMIADAAQRFSRSMPPPQRYTGSLLGMAQGRSAPPPPRPMPINNYPNAGMGGGD